MPFTPEQMREHRRKLRERGVCTRCHHRKAGASRSICDPCSATLKAHRKRNRRRWRATPDKCGTCGKRIPGVYSECATCRRAKARSLDRARKRAIDEGRCAMCLKPQGPPASYYCPVCAERHARRMMMRRAVYGRAT